MIEETLGRIAESIADVERKFYGAVVGTVVSPLDPLPIGRVQVQLPFIDSLGLSSLARVAVPMAGLSYGTYFIPNIGDEVLVVFENGDINCPYIIGCLWSVAAPAPLPSPLPQIRAIRTPAGNQVVFTEVPPSITLQTAPTPPVTIPAPPTPTGPYQTISMSLDGIKIMSPTPIQIVSPTGIQIMVGANVISLTPAGITITGTAVNIVGTTVNIKGGMVNIN